MGQMEFKQKELSNCTFVKTVLMLLVVLYHCMAFWTGTWFVEKPVYASLGLSMISKWLNSFHIYAFVLVSGYLFSYLKCECEKYTAFSAFFFAKTKRLLIPYIFVALVWVIPFTVHYFDYSSVGILKRFGLGTSPGQLWFLLMLFGVFMIFYPLSHFFRSHNILGAIFVVLIYTFGEIGPAVLPNVFQVFRACTYIPLFWLGFKLRQYGSMKLRKIPSVVYLFFDVFLFAFGQYLVGLNGTFFAVVKLGVDFMLHIVGALMAFVVLQRIADCIDWKANKKFELFSKNLMPIYLFHQQVIYVFIYWLNGLLNPYIHTAVNFVSTMIISLLISRILMRFKWTRILVGEK